MRSVVKSLSRWLAPLFCFTGIVALPAIAQLPDARPPIVRYQSDIEAYPQNFAIAADHDGYVYIGNADGVLIFDGEEWQQVVLPNGDIVRSLAWDNESRVYVGGFDEFGYLERTTAGDFRYISLLSLFEEELGGEPFADIWRIGVTDLGVFFVGLEHLFLFQPDTQTQGFWKHEGSLGPIGEVNDRVYLQWRGEGIKSFDGESWTLHPHATLARDFLVGLLPLDDELVVVSNDGPWFTLSDGVFTEIPDSRTIPLKQSMTHGFIASEEVIGVATQLGVIVFYDLQSGEADIVRVADGFVPDVVRTPAGNVLSVNNVNFSTIH